MWAVRKNFATAIGRLAIAAFDREHETVERWFLDKIKANQDFWLKGIASGDLPPKGSFFNICPRPAERISRNAVAFYPYGTHSTTATAGSRFVLWPEGTVSTAKEAGFAKASALGKKQQILNTPWEIERISTPNA
jgi:hypothetical protein